MKIQVVTSQKGIVIGDLGIAIQPGIPVWITEQQYSSSPVLQNLEKLGSIKCINKPRARVIHHVSRAPIRTTKMSRPHKGGLHTTDTGNNNTPNVDEVVEKAVAKATNEVLAMVMGTLQDMLSVQQTQTQNTNLDIQGQVEQAVTNAIKQSGGIVSSGNVVNTSSVNIEEPMFIPSKIVQEEKQVQVNAQQTSTDTTQDLQEALRALKQLRKNK